MAKGGLSHSNTISGIKKLLSGNLVKGFKLDAQANPDPVCEACKAGKMHSDPFPISTSRASKPLQLAHSDVHGPVKVSTHQGYRHWVTFIDDHSHFRAVYLLKKKSERFAAFKQFKAWAENLTGVKLGTLRDDKGGEYMSGEFEDFCINHGIQRQYSVRNRPQQNGVAERVNRTITPATNWQPQLSLINPPFEAFYGTKQDLSMLHVWGCAAYVLTHRDK